MRIEKAETFIGWTVSCKVGGKFFVKCGTDKLKLIDEIFEQIKWTLSLN